MVKHVELTGTELRALQESRHAIPIEASVFRIEGSGTIACLQGMVTNDLANAPQDALLWTAFLTPKGMIISDCWIRRDGDAAWVIIPASATEAIRTLFTRTLPPRLAKVQDHSSTTTVRWLVGADSAIPEQLRAGRPIGAAPFRALILAEHAAADVDQILEASGWHSAPGAWADAVRILTGWPALGREIDEKTLPQEVRFDELGGVKYDKGCYTGQETVARLHFRGHANRELRGLHFAAGETPSSVEVRAGEKAVGTVRTLGTLGDATVALAVLRREVSRGDVVMVGGAAATVIELPEWGSLIRTG